MTTTTNTTTSRKTYDLAAIMREAWQIRRDSAAEMGCSPSVVLFGECLRMAWARAEARYATVNAETVRREWYGMTGVAQLTWLRRAVRRATKTYIGESIEDRYLQWSELIAFDGIDDLIEGAAHKAWIRLAGYLKPDKLAANNARRAAEGRRPLKLSSLVYRAAESAWRSDFDAEVKHISARTDNMQTGTDGEPVNVVEELCYSDRDSAENAAIARAELATVAEGLDDYGKTILQGIIRGDTEREIAKGLPISAVAVHKRIVKIRAALKAQELDDITAAL